MKRSWYSAKCIFLLPATKSRRQIYEERVTLIKALDSDTAIKKAEKNARKYCKDIENCKFVGLVDVFELFDKKIRDTTEIYSSMQTSSMASDDFLNRFYPDVSEDCEADGETHRWYKKDDKEKACYHCRVVRTGRVK